MRRVVRFGVIVLIAVGCSATPGSGSRSPSGAGLFSAAPIPSAPNSPVLPSPTAPPVVAAGEPWLAYSARATGGQFGVLLVRLDGTGVHWPMSGVPGLFQEHPDWSPDGNRLVFSETAGDGTKDLWVADVDGSNASQIVDCQAPCSWADEAAWSPDGTSIVFQRMVAAGGRRTSTIESFDVVHRTTRIVLTAKDGMSFYAPRWAPDGRSLVVEHATDGATVDDPPTANAIAVIDLAGGAPILREITTPDRLANNPDWSPRGDLIVFSLPGVKAGFAGPADLYVIAPGGGSMRRLTSLVEGGGQAIQPTFAPDGASVQFVLDDPASTDSGLASVAVTGGDPYPTTSSGYLGGVHPRLRPTP